MTSGSKGSFQFLAAMLVAIIGIAASRAAAQCAEEQAEFWAADAGASDEFGWAVAVSGNVALVGAWRDNAAGSLSGSAYVFRLDGANWVQEQKIVPPDLQAFDFFGWSVALDGDTAVIGNISDDDVGENGGSAYVYSFDGSGWQQQAKLLASDGAADDHFGVSVSISGDAILVGADQDSDNGTWSGSAYVFERLGTQWTESRKLLPSTPSSYEHFGAAVAVDADVAVVGAYGGPSQLFRGTAYVFRRVDSVWQQETSLTGSQSVAGDFFAAAVGVSGGRVLCGARWADLAGQSSTIVDTGEAYLFSYDGAGWSEEQRLTEVDPQPGDGFGYSVAIRGALSLIGVHNRDHVGPHSGEAVLFCQENDAWQPEPRLIPSDPATEDMFGLSVALGSQFAVIGAPRDDDQGSNAGSAYVFDLSACIPVYAGDINGDGAVDMNDVAMFVGVLGGWDTDPGRMSAADLNGDGEPNGLDVQMFVAAVMGG